MSEAPKLNEVNILATSAGRLEFTQPIDVWDYRRLNDEERCLLYATIRAQIVQAAAQQYPGHLYAFTDPVVEKPDGEFTIAEDKAISRAVMIRCHAFVWAPQVVQHNLPDTLETLLEALADGDLSDEVSVQRATAAIQNAYVALEEFRSLHPKTDQQVPTTPAPV